MLQPVLFLYTVASHERIVHTSFMSKFIEFTQWVPTHKKRHEIHVGIDKCMVLMWLLIDMRCMKVLWFLGTCGS